ncbi:hypothetical protein TKK_0012443 [Trichogramma kaykai]
MSNFQEKVHQQITWQLKIFPL